MSSPIPLLRRLAVVTAAAALFGKLLTGSATGATASQNSTQDSTQDSTRNSIDWQPCTSPYGEGDFECGTLTVPVDWSQPDGATVESAFARSLASDPDHRIGSLLVDPGGPGQSGVDMALSAPFTFPAELSARFDFVGFDPRGVADSTPTQCDGDAYSARSSALTIKDEDTFTRTG